MSHQGLSKKQQGLDAARDLAVEALNGIAADPEKMGFFMNISGLVPADLRQAAQSPGFFVAILDFLCADQELIVSVATANHRRPEAYDQARQLLAGPEREFDG